MQDNTHTLPWIEKYRPKSLDDIVSQNEIVSTLKKFIISKKIPHLLFYGPPGTGKTSAINACVRELYGIHADVMVIDINASEERGIEVVRNRIIQFVSSKNMFYEENDPTYIPFKLVILDEADAMTQDAQAILRNVIEKYTHNARFCLICNYIKKISDALLSRCVCLRFKPLQRMYLCEKIDEIANKESICIDNDAKNMLIKRSCGDMRRILNIMQTISLNNTDITTEIINKTINYPSYSHISNILNSLINDSANDSYNLIDNIKYTNSYSLNDILTEISNIVIELCTGDGKFDINIEKYNLLLIIQNMRNIQYDLSVCTNENIQLGALVGAFKCSIKN